MSGMSTSPKADFAVFRFAPFLLLSILFLTGLVGPASVFAQKSGGQVPFKIVTIIDRNELGESIGAPTHVMFDRAMDETYVLSGGKIIVYGPDFYPYIALGKGRGVEAPQGMAIDRDGMLYVCQRASDGKPARITIFNAAFFPVRDIFFKGFPHSKDFVPNRLAVSQDGLIYVAATLVPGVLVMDQQGKVLRWLKPKGYYSARLQIDIEAPEDGDTSGKDDSRNGEQAEGGSQAETGNEDLALEDQFSGLPAELIPKKKKTAAKEKGKGQHPVIIVDIEIDQEGHLYFLSETEGKVYVYSADEEFLYSFGSKGGAPGKLGRPRGLAVDEQKKCVYVIDYLRQTLLIYDLAGKYILDFGGVGSGPGWFRFPTDVVLNRKGDVIIADLYNSRVQVLNLQFQSRFPLFGAKPEPSEDKDVTTASYPPKEDVKKKPEVEGLDSSLEQPEALSEQSDSGVAVDSKEELSPPEEKLPAPISPSSAGEEESLSATGDDSPAPEVVSPEESPEPEITEEPIGANMDDF